MLPVNKRYPVDELLIACQDYVVVTGRRVTFEWALVNGVNDAPAQAHLLARKLKGLLCHVNVIPLNPTLGYSGNATTRTQAENFRNILKECGIPCTIRLRRGIEIQAGCGQLASLSN
jgi:23S rRNA (adenine2503-C2)-methyltransferase